MKTWLNYHHLYYFWLIAQEESISAAASRLRLAQPTLSAQLKQLEESLGVQLFDRRGRSLSLTQEGKVVYRYAQNIFSLGEELMAVLQGTVESHGLLLRVGISDSLPKLVSRAALAPALSLQEGVKLECYEGKREVLFSQLGAHDLDLVLTDSPFASEVAVKAYNHLLGSSSVTICAAPRLLQKYGKSPDQILETAPYLLPTRNSMLRRALDRWFDKQDIQPKIIAEFDDSALLKTFGADGLGVFPIVSTVEKEVTRIYGVKRVKKLPDVREEFYAVSLERKVTHPALKAITEAAKSRLRQEGA